MPHYTAMFEGLVRSPRPWLFGHLWLPASDDGSVLESVEILLRFETRVEISDFTMCSIDEVLSMALQKHHQASKSETRSGRDAARNTIRRSQPVVGGRWLPGGSENLRNEEYALRDGTQAAPASNGSIDLRSV